MSRLKSSLIALVVLLILVGVLPVLMPFVGRGQGGSPNAPPHRDLRRFYVTRTMHNGSQARTACAEGYHMASLWEILDPSNLRYDTDLGVTSEDSGFGPPSLSSGWIRTGFPAANGILGPGEANCQAWTSSKARISEVKFSLVHSGRRRS